MTALALNTMVYRSGHELIVETFCGSCYWMEAYIKMIYLLHKGKIGGYIFFCADVKHSVTEKIKVL